MLLFTLFNLHILSVLVLIEKIPSEILYRNNVWPAEQNKSNFDIAGLIISIFERSVNIDHLHINFIKWFDQFSREERGTWEVQLLGKMCCHLDSSRAVSVSHKTSRSQKVPVDNGELCDHEMAERSRGWVSVFSVKVVHQLIMKWGEFTTFSDSLFIMTFIFFVLVVFTASCELVILTITN